MTHPRVPDDQDFEEIYQSIPVGLTVTAAESDHAETLRSFCYSLKGAAIRLGSNAMFFLCHYGNRQWLTKGIEHFRGFVEKHKTKGVRLFLIDQSMQSPAYVNREIAQLIRDIAEGAGVGVILTAIAHPPEEGTVKQLAVLKGGVISFFGRSAIALTCRSNRRLVRSERHLPGTDDVMESFGEGSTRKIEALANLAERPGTEAEGKLAQEMLARLGLSNQPTLKRFRERSRRAGIPFGGLTVVVTQSEIVLEDDFYSATTVFGGQEKNYSRLYFLKTCPQPPDGHDRPSS